MYNNHHLRVGELELRVPKYAREKVSRMLPFDLRGGCHY